MRITGIVAGGAPRKMLGVGTQAKEEVGGVVQLPITQEKAEVGGVVPLPGTQAKAEVGGVAQLPGT